MNNLNYITRFKFIVKNFLLKKVNILKKILLKI
jgi:hypothetical protein